MYCLRLRSPSFESTSVLSVTPSDDASMQQLVNRGWTNCTNLFLLQKETLHVESYHIIIVNIFNYMNNNVAKNTSLITLGLNIMLVKKYL